MAEKYQEAVTPNVVPASFSPAPEQYAPQITQEMRSNQSRWAQGYAANRINYLENQLHVAHYKREVYRLEQGYSDVQAEAKLIEDIKTAKTARTVMMDHISEWAGNFEEAHFKEVVLPDVWNKFVNKVKGEPVPDISPEEPISPDDEIEPESETKADEAFAPEELEPEAEVQPLPSARYDDLASQPKSEVVPPEQISLGDILSKIEKGKDSED